MILFSKRPLLQSKQPTLQTIQMFYLHEQFHLKDYSSNSFCFQGFDLNKLQLPNKPGVGFFFFKYNPVKMLVNIPKLNFHENRVSAAAVQKDNIAPAQNFITLAKAL